MNLGLTEYKIIDNGYRFMQLLNVIYKGNAF